MGLLSTLSTAASGLRTAQAGIDLVSQNVANAGSAGYVRRTMQPVQALAGGETTGVRAGEVQRTLDALAQKQLWLENAGAGYTALAARYAGQVDKLFGQPGGEGSLDGAVNDFQGAVQTLAADPGSATARAALLAQGKTLAARIGSLAGSVQALRSDAEARIGAAVTRANELLAGIATLNGRIGPGGGAASAGLLDERDRMIGELSQLVDIRTSTGADGAIRVATGSGQTLVDGPLAAKFGFDGRGTLGANAVYSADPARSGAGGLTLVGLGGATIDLMAEGGIRSGEIAAALQARDGSLVQAQRQLDELAAGLSRALSDRAAPVIPATNGGAGYQIDITGWQPGNAITVDYKEGSTPRRLILVPSNQGAPAISPADTADPNATVIRVDLSGGFAAAATAIQAQLDAAGIGLSVDSPAANSFRIVDDGAGNTTDVAGVSAGITVTGLADGVPELPFFVDGRDGKPFTGSFEGGSRLTGLAQRLGVNPALLADPSRLVVYSTSPATPQGDATRPQRIADALGGARRFPAAGLGGVEASLSTSLAGYAQRLTAHAGEVAELAERLDSGQQVALAAVQDRFEAGSAVNVDEEMARLIALQTAYGANARVMTAARDMLDLLMRM